MSEEIKETKNTKETIEKDKELKVRSMRVDEETYDRFKTLAQKDFSNQGHALSSLLNLYDMENNKKFLPGREDEIDNFHTLTNSLSEMFIRSLEYNRDTDARIRDEYKAFLRSKDETIISLQEKLGLSTEKIDLMREEVIDTSRRYELLSNEYTELQVKNEQIKEVLAGVKEQLLDKIESINILKERSEELQEKLDGALNQNILYEKRMAELQGANGKLIEEKEMLIEEKKIAIKGKNESLSELEKEKTEFKNKEQILKLELEKKHMEELNVAKDEYLKKLEELRDKNNEFVNELYQVKRENDKLQSVIDMSAEKEAALSGEIAKLQERLLAVSEMAEK